MKVKNIFSIFLLIFMVNSTAIAKGAQLEQDMIDLEQTYIPALFFTGKPAGDQTEEQLLAISISKLSLYKATWTAFSSEYKTYRSSRRNWISYFDDVEGLIDDADELLGEGKRSEAHEVLEEIRTLIAEFRGRNGFPKFIVDQFTDFHTIMGEIIFVASGAFGDNTIEILFELYEEASHAWSKVEKNAVDPEAWGLTSADEGFYYSRIQVERLALDEFEWALSYADQPEIKAAAMALKPPQAAAYLTLGDVLNHPLP